MSKKIAAVAVNAGKFSVVEMGGSQNCWEVQRFIDKNVPEGGLNPAWLKEIWEKARFVTKKVILLIPQEQLVYRILQFPQLTAEQLQAALQLEFATKHELFKVIETKMIARQTQVKVAIVKEAELQELISPFEVAGLKVQWCGLRSRGINAFLNFHHDYLGTSKNQIFLDLGATETEFGLIDTEQLIYSRRLKLGINDLHSENVDFNDEFLEEFRLSLMAAAQLVKELPAKIWLFGEVALGQLSLERIESELKVKFFLPHKTSFSGTLTEIHTPQLAALLGIALDELGWDPHPELRFQTKAQSQQETERWKLLNLTKGIGIVVLIILGLVLGVKAQAVKEEKNQAWIEQNSNRINALKKLEQTTQQNLATIRTLESWLEARGSQLEFLNILQESLPEVTVVESLIIEDGKVKSLSGITPTVSELLRKFRSVPALRGLKLKGSINNAKDGREQFQLEGTLEKKEPVQ